MAVQTKRTRRVTKQAPNQVIAAAAKRNGVPVWVLMGVKLIETGSGSGRGAVSSAGAQGPFQFEPATAAGMGIKDPNNLAESADGAARLLKQYHDKYGSWNAAFEAYNGGPGAVGQGFAYTEKDVIAKLREYGHTELAAEANGGPESKLASLDVPFFNPFDPGGILKDGAEGKAPSLGNLLDFPDEVLQAATATTAFFQMLTSVDFWIRVGEAVGALILIYMGLHSLTGQGPSPSTIGKTAVEAGTVAAVK